jgi:DNA polymerase-3 subunit epsilon
MTNYLFYDTETSGFIPKNFDQSKVDSINQPWICQMGILLTDGQQDFQRMSLLVKASGRSISPGAEAVHKISVETCNKFGVPEITAGRILNQMITACDMIVCHNIAFDIPMTDILFKRQGWNMDAERLAVKEKFCTMQSTTEYCALPTPWNRGFKWPKLEELHKKLFGFSFEGAHDALADVEATRKCFFELKGREII